jgi:non-ribosomal peptide synthetase component F
VLSGWNETKSEYPRDQTITQLFAERVTLHPTATAVQFGNEELSYAELDRRSNQLARWLVRQGVTPDTLVGIRLERSINLIVALVGVLKAGGAYVSLDSSYPAERIAFMLGDTRAPVILTQEALAETLAAGDARLTCLDRDAAKIASESAEPLVSHVTADSLAYVSYTSGSTGQPKGVCVPQRGVVRLVRGTDYARFSRSDVFLQFAPIAFDASTLEIWGALLNGGKTLRLSARSDFAGGSGRDDRTSRNHDPLADGGPVSSDDRGADRSTAERDPAPRGR